jgi:hypothetical protein
MRWTPIAFAACAACVVMHGRAAEAQPNYELNRIKGTMDTAEARFKAGELDSCRFQLNQLKQDMKGASIATRTDPAFARVKARAAALEKRLSSAESAAGQVADADQKASDAGSDLNLAKVYADDDPEKSLEMAKSCMAKLSEAFKLDPGTRTRETKALGSPTGKAMYAECKGLKIKAEKFLSGESKMRAADTDHGKEGIPAFDTAFAAFENDDLDAETLLAGIVAAEKCKSAHGQLTSILLSSRSRKPYYDEEREMMPTASGKISLKEFGQRCLDMEIDLKKRKARGCGFKDVNVQQELIGRRRWSSVTRWGATVYQVGSCKKMPHRSKFPGASRKFAGKLKGICGRKAVYVMTDSSWRTWESNGKVFRSISGACWENGKLNFGTTPVLVQY